MVQLTKPLIFVLLASVLWSSCSMKKSPDEILERTWVMADTTTPPPDGFPVCQSWHIEAEHRFILPCASTGNRQGTWDLSGDSILRIQLFPRDTSLSWDSSVFVISGGKPAIRYFKNGKALGTLGSVNTQDLTPAIAFKIKRLSPESLTLDLNGTSFQLKSVEPLQVAGGFNIRHIFRGLVGLIILLLVAFLLSTHRKAINFKLVATGIVMQIIIALMVFEIPFVKSLIEMVAGFFVTVLDFSRSGSNFLFAGLLDTHTVGYLFAFQVLPTIIFFSALTSLLYYIGFLQKVVYAMAWIMNKTMRLSGAESLSTAANIFLGQTEAPLMIKPYLAGMSRSEILCVMIGGMANIAGGVMAAYVGFLGGPDPVQQHIFATHLLTASVLSAPAAIVVSKMLMPETEPIKTDARLEESNSDTNVLEAISNGTTEGVRLAINVGAMLLVFTALIALLNYLVGQFGSWTGLNDLVRLWSHGNHNELSFQVILGYLFSPFTLVLGISTDDMVIAGQLLGEKTVLNEFYAYSSLATLKDSGAFMHPRTIVILTYALCGFANFASIGIQIGGIGTMAPNQKTTLSQLGIRALIGGTMACFMTATIVGMLL